MLAHAAASSAGDAIVGYRGGREKAVVVDGVFALAAGECVTEHKLCRTRCKRDVVE
jgi:hypothetical protein